MYKAYHYYYDKQVRNGDYLFFDTSLQLKEFQITDPELDQTFGKAGSFSFKVPPTNDQYEQFKEVVSYVDLYRNDKLIFTGRVFTQTKDFNNICSVTCEGIMSIFNDSTTAPFVVNTKSLRTALNTILTPHNAQVDSYKVVNVGNLYYKDKISEADAKQYRIYLNFDNYGKTIERLEELIDNYGGYLSLRKGSNGSLYLDWYEEYVSESNQTINFGENLMDLTQESTVDDLTTVLIAYGANENNTNTYTRQIEDTSSINKYGRIISVVSWSGVQSQTELNDLAGKYIAAVNKKKVTINVTAVDLARLGSDINFFEIGQKVKIKSSMHNFEDSMVVQSKSSQLLNPAGNTISVGTTKTGYISKTKKSLSSKS